MNPMITIIRPYASYALAIAMALGAAGGVYWYIRHQGVLAAEQAQREREVANYKAAAEHANQVALQLETKLAQAQAQAQEINERLNDELQKHPVYRECKLPADGVQLLNRALAGPGAR